MSTESTQTNNSQVNIQSSIEYTRSLQQQIYISYYYALVTYLT